MESQDLQQRIIAALKQGEYAAVAEGTARYENTDRKPQATIVVSVYGDVTLVADDLPTILVSAEASYRLRWDAHTASEDDVDEIRINDDGTFDIDPDGEFSDMDCDRSEIRCAVARSSAFRGAVHELAVEDARALLEKRGDVRLDAVRDGIDALGAVLMPGGDEDQRVQAVAEALGEDAETISGWMDGSERPDDIEGVWLALLKETLDRTEFEGADAVHRLTWNEVLHFNNKPVHLFDVWAEGESSRSWAGNLMVRPFSTLRDVLKQVQIMLFVRV